MSEIERIDWGEIAYDKAWALQKEWFDTAVANKQKSGYTPKHRLIFCEHPHVYTLGKRGEIKNLLISEAFLQEISATCVHVDRGGDITYHGPGQMVVYPILDLEDLGLSLRQYIFFLEEVVIDTLRHFGIKGERLDKATGVWLDPLTAPRKICAIGVRASRYISMHGLACNIHPKMEYFSYINPCGFSDKSVTSLEVETESPISIESVKDLFFRSFMSHIKNLPKR